MNDLKKTSRIFSLFLCFTIISSLFVGCSDSSNTETYYAFCGFAGVKENANNEFYFLKESVSNSTAVNSTDKTITVEECYFDETEKTLIIDLIYNICCCCEIIVSHQNLSRFDINTSPTEH